MEKIPVLVVDDQNLFRQTLALLINSVDQFELLGDFDGAGSLFRQLSYLTNDEVCVAIIDMDMPGINGIELNRMLHNRHPNIRVIILSVHINPSLITQMIDDKAAAYLAKNCDKNELITAIQSVYKTGFYINRETLKAIQHAANLKNKTQKNVNDTSSLNLNEREKQILQLICLEQSNAEISKELYISVRTVEGYRISLQNKTGSRTIAGLVLFAIKNGLFTVTV